MASDKPPAYKKRASTVTSFTPVEPQVRSLLAQTPSLPATVLAERVGWTGSITWFRDNVRRIRPDYQPADPVDTLTHRPGEQIQCDLTFPAGGLPDETGTAAEFPVLVMVASHSRFMAARMLPTRTTGDLIAGMWALLSTSFQAIPEHLLWDHETGIGQKKLTEPALAFAGALGTRIRQAPPRDPETKGVVERANGYLKSSFFPGRRFTDPADVQHQLDDWITNVANQRIHATTRTVPVTAWAADKVQMTALPPYPPQVGVIRQVRLPRNYYVAVDANRYSVDPLMINRIVTVHADLDRVIVRAPGGAVVAEHLRVWGAHQTITDPQHAATAKQMRHQLTIPRPDPQAVEVEQADLSIYDRLAGMEVGA
ncbi:IS21 family transposase [Corynebacterium sanguinis]|nr:IS21 family transposase [Corynebacterium sanguinis]MDN8577908.1 IS21 family transposase [Corynebacterium sanguinis]